MKKTLLVIALFFGITQCFFGQEEDGVISLAIPVRNSLKFNRFNINPTFSFVREQNKYISINNKREWVQFEDAPQTYLLSYSGRFRENIGVGIGFFQQNYGVLTSYGGILNLAYNAMLQPDSNLTFGLNIGFYQSGVHEGKVVTNVADPSLENIPSNSILSVSPGINYGTVFFDFGVSVNNLVQYNFKTSQLLKEDPQQVIQAHIMYTGYMSSYGFLDESKFSGIIKSEFKKDKTVLSGLAMLTVPKGIWGQVGYNTQYGISGGIGLNITSQIAIEYNYEKAIGDLSAFGSSHDITLAYKFKNTNNFYYSGDDEEETMLFKKKKRRVVSSKPKVDVEARAIIAKEKADARAAKIQAKADKDARLAAAAAATKAQAKEDARLAAEAATLEETDEDTRLAAETATQAQAEEDARLAAEAAAQTQAEEDARLAAEAAAQAQAEEDARLAAEAAAQAQADEDARLAAEAAAQAQAEEDARLAAEADKALEKETSLSEITQKDVIAKEMFAITESAKISKEKQELLFEKLNEVVATKDKDLKDLKEENDLSEKGIYSEPKPFKSIAAENRMLESLQTEVDQVIQERNEEIVALENLYNNRLKDVSNKKDETNQYYLNAIQTLKEEQLQSKRAKEKIVSTLESIKIATDFERKRRIKRAVYDNEKDRYLKDKATLESIIENTPLSTEPIAAEDFDFGEAQSATVQILKGMQNIEEGYYIIIAVHSDKEKRDDFIEKVVSTGQSNINFFFDVNTNKYFIYYEKFDYVDGAMQALEAKGSKPYNGKMSVIKIEN
jgi:type IX secretion system PorP/SprF family membrane protein